MENELVKRALYQYELMCSRCYSLNVLCDAFQFQLHIVNSVFQSMDDIFKFLFVQRLAFYIFGENVRSDFYPSKEYIPNYQSYPGFKYSILLYIGSIFVGGHSKIIQYFIITTTAHNCIII